MHIHLDAVGGAAGDMFVAAILNALPELTDRVLRDVAAVLPPGAGKARLREATASGLKASRFGLDERGGAHANRHGHVGYGDFRDQIAAAGLAHETAEAAQAILRRLAEAEARVHGIALEEVHFHELADWDTLMDVVAAGSLLGALAGAGWSVSPLPLGSGLVKMAHGLLPVPAPATSVILEGYAWRQDGLGGERVTPTGAAILAQVTGGRGNGANPGGRLRAVGHGAGSKTFPGLPNVLRAMVFETGGPARAEALTLLAFEIDDMTGEEVATAADRLRAAEGVRDLLLIPAQGKKGRPVIRFELQSAPELAESVAERVFAETSTLGLRRQEVRRDVLERRAEAAPNGLRRKRAFRPGGETVKVESDDLASIATLAARRAARGEAES